MSDNTVMPKPAASIVLLRESLGEVQVYLLRRHRKAKFMSSSYVFPGGIADTGDANLGVTAARELFEEAGVLLGNPQGSAIERQSWRDALNGASQNGAGLPREPIDWDGDALQYYARWITPSIESRRYSATFFIARLPEGQVASPDNRETVDEVWQTPAQALQLREELRLPPPQIRILHELCEPASRGMDAVFAFAANLSSTRHAILPRRMADADPCTMLLPWDPQYQSHGEGESLPMPVGHALAGGPSRFVRTPGSWLHTTADSRRF